MGNAGTDGADGKRPRRGRDDDRAEPDAERPAEADGAQWGAGYPDRPPTDRAPEWPLTRENQIVEAASAKPDDPTANRSGRDEPSGGDATGRPGDRDRAETPAVDGHGRDAATVEPSTADPTRRHGQAQHPTADPPGGGRGDETDGRSSHRDRAETSATADPARRRGRDDAPVPPVASGPPWPDETTVLPAAHDAGPPPGDAETSLLPGLEAAHHTGQAAVPTEGEAPSGFLVAQGLSAMGFEGPIFTSVSVAAERGEIVTVVGDAGTGRTALLLALAGRFKCQAGSLSVDGDTRPARIRASVAVAWAPPAVVFEENHTVAAVLTESAVVNDVAEAEVRRCCDELRLDLDTGLAFAQLSRVDQLLLALASAWASGAPAVALDDLDSGMDDAGTARLWQAARRVADDQRLVLVTAVRAGTVADKRVHPRPLAPAAAPRHGTAPPS